MVEGMAAQIIADDENRREQELVCLSDSEPFHVIDPILCLGRFQHSTQTSELGPKARP